MPNVRGSIVFFGILVACLTAVLASPQTTDVPMLPDGTVSFGPAPGEDGAWELHYIENMADYVAGAGPSRSVSKRSAAAEPQVPFMRWSAAVYNYNTHNE